MFLQFALICSILYEFRTMETKKFASRQRFTPPPTHPKGCGDKKNRQKLPIFNILPAKRYIKTVAPCRRRENYHRLLTRLLLI